VFFFCQTLIAQQHKKEFGAKCTKAVFWGKKVQKSSYLDLMSSSSLLEQNMILNFFYFIG